MKGNEKIINALAILINSMSDLSTLATEHGLESQLYEGGGLEKIMFLVGEHRHRKFRSENIGHLGTKKQEWQKLKVFLQKELTLLERLQLDRKTAISMGLTVDHRKPTPSKSSGGAHSSVVESGLVCHICDLKGHTTIKTARGNTILP